MDAQRKAEVEQRAVLVLGAVFVAVLVLGPLKGLGLLRPRVSAQGASGAPPTQAVSATQTIGAMMEEHRHRMEPDLPAMEQAQAQVRVARSYTAQELRDPFKSLLPEPASPLDGEDARLAAWAAGEPELPEPPDLRVQGLFWGGDRPQAIINDDIYELNDLVEGVRIVAIDGTGVTVDQEGVRLFYSTELPAEAGAGTAPAGH